jgi:putative ABC transport system permease protein
VSRARMLWWMSARATLLRGRRGRALTALVAVVTVAAVATAILNLSRDVQAKVRGELRGYGANVVLAAPEGKSLPANSLGLVESLLRDGGRAVPFAYIVARTADDVPVVVVGTDFARARKANSWWEVNAWPAKRNEALLGARAARSLGFESLELRFKQHKVKLVPAGTLSTGGAEESRVYISQEGFFAWTGVQSSVIEISASLSGKQLDTFQRELKALFPAAEVREVRQITEAEGRVFTKTRAALLVSVVLIVLTAGLCVLANLTSSVLDRRKDFAIMKALGASEWLAGGIFAVEFISLGVLGGMVGYVIGIGVAAWIGRASLQQAVMPRADVFPVILAVSVALTLIAAVMPLRLLRRIQPAAILKGE